MKQNKRTARIPRFYYDGQMQPGCDLELDKGTSHHLLTVLRAKPGMPLTVFNGDGNNYLARLADETSRSATRRAVLNIQTCTPADNESPLRITLVQCVSRSERMDITLRQAVELGVSCIQPVYSRQSIKQTDEKRAVKRQQHWQAITVSACEQSGRAVLPTLNSPLDYELWLQQAKNSENIVQYVLSPLAPCSLTQHASSMLTASDSLGIALIIGPESGLDSDEIDKAIDYGAEPVHLGRRILRTETAGPACITLLQSILGDLGA